MKHHHILIVLATILSISSCKAKPESVFGKYTTFLPEYLERTQIKYKHNASVAPMWVMMVYLREDSSFVMGSCDLQIWETGYYKYNDDSLVFHNIYSFKDSSRISNRTMLYNPKKGYIYYRYPTKDSSQAIEFPEAIALLRKSFKRSHRGFLRNERMSVDSLLAYNKFLPLDSQYVWIDEKLGR